MFDIHYDILSIVEGEKDAMKRRNEERKKTIIIEAERKAAEEKELPRHVVTSISRFQILMNMQFERRTGFLLKRSADL